jgi:Glycosyl hydrolases family 39
VKDKEICRVFFLVLILVACLVPVRGQNIYVSPKLIAFPNQALNTTSAAYNVTLSNNQAGTLTISNIQASAPFSQMNNCGTALAPNAQCTISVKFTPTAKQYYSSTLVITDSAANSPQNVSLTGNGVVPVSVAPLAINFPNQAINTTSNGTAVTITNNQSATLNFGTISSSGAFGQTNNCGTTLAGGASCTVTVTFGPTAIQTYYGTLQIPNDGPNAPQSVPLTGSGVAPVNYTPKQISFPDQGIYSTSTAYSISFTNNEPTPLTLAIQTAAPFAQTNTCGTSLAAGATCSINVTFTPTLVQYYSGTLTISGAPGSPFNIPVVGNGIIPVSFTPKVGGLYFSHQIANTASTPQAVTITNNQPTPLTFTSMSSSAAFPFTTNCGNGAGGGTLAPGATCTVQVSFNPPAVASYTANLLVYENAYGSPVTIPVQGTGISGTPANMVTVKPPSPCILPSATEQFSADITGLASSAVYWYVDGIKGGNATVGTISPGGLYTAPSTTNVHVIKAVSQLSSVISGAASLTISTAPNFQIYPYVSSIPTGGQQSYQGQSCKVPVPGVTFTVDNIPGGNSTVGTITSAGVYTAPNTAGKHTVRVTDPALNSTSGGVVTVFSSITADFASRANSTAPIPANIFGYGRGEAIHNATDRALLTEAGITVARIGANILDVFATQTPDWTQIDPIIADVKATGQHAMLQLNQSPSWLQPTTGGCAGAMFAAPTDVNQWAQVAAAYVAHMDSAFPGVVTDYEIWNEPNSTGLCTAADHMNTYMAIYGAAAPAMKAQAAQDGQTIRVGGPVLSNFSQTWIDTLLNTATTAPYVDFVSYHQYFFGSSNLQVQWDQYTGDWSLYNAMQDPSIGAFGTYNKVLGRVALGKQPGGVNTPIYVTEFNTNWAFLQDCCRNNPTYGPVFNALYAVYMLDSVYNGSAHMPNNLTYFASSAYPYFCLIGVHDTNSDCMYTVGATPTPYPQYYAFQLLASPEYLGLQGGGYMAKSISTPSGGGGLATTAFYTPTQDALVIVNPTPTSYPAINISFANPGFSDTQGTLYSIQNGAQIKAADISFSTQGTSRAATIAVPPYSVQAISLK